jgi:hypothetical protein
LAALDSREDDELAEIELTYSILDDINQARPAFGSPAMCIIQVLRNNASDMSVPIPPFEITAIVDQRLDHWRNVETFDRILLWPGTFSSLR